jgi:glycerol-3-phosphate dehydrogenase
LPSHHAHPLPAGYSINLPARLVQEYNIPYAVAVHLTKAYGGRAFEVCDILREEESQAALQRNRESGIDNPEDSGGITRLVEGYPYITAEVKYATRKDWARRVDDILARRTRLLFLNKDAAIRAVPRIVEIMAAELGWDAERKQEEAVIAYQFIHHFGGSKPAVDEGELPRLATEADIEHHFDKLDGNKDGSIPYDDIVKVGISLGRHLSEEEIASCITICDNRKLMSIERSSFVAWWNSEHANPLLTKMKDHMTSQKPEGPGTMFG